MNLIKTIILTLCIIISNSTILFAQVESTAEATNSSRITVTFPDDLDSESERNSLENKILEFNQTLYVIDTYSWEKYGQVKLSSQRLQTPTEIHLPGSSDYRTQITYNAKDQITLDDGANTVYPSPLPWANSNGTLRTGSKVDNLVARLVNTEYGWNLVPVETPNFYGNPRPSELSTPNSDEIRVCSFNLEHYIVSNFGSGFGPDNQTESNKQHAKISKALNAINADIYALCEVQTGQKAIEKLTNQLNSDHGSNVYSYINDGSSTNGSFSKVGYIYRSDKLSPIKSIKENNLEIQNRKKGQGFTQKSNGGSFIILINHYKAKSGSGYGDNADQNDGQGTYNGTRTREAESTVKFAAQCANYYNDKDVLILGDLNSHSMEDPITTIEEADFTNLIYHFNTDDHKYSYVFFGQTGCLDHALANESMLSQVQNCYVYHINTDEPSLFGYSRNTAQDNMYRCSDHDPVIVELKINATDTSIQKPEMSVIYSHSDNDIFTIINAKNHYIDIFNYNGIKLYSGNITENTQNFSISNLNLNTGVYILKMKETKIIEPKTTTLKLIVNR